MSAYSDWIGRSIIAPRSPADRASLTRAIKVVAGSMQGIPDEKMRRLLGAKLAVLPFLESVLTQDESVRSALGVPFEAVRQLAADVVVRSDAYVAAVVAALAGSPAGISDRKGWRYQVRPVSLLIAARLRTVVYAREDGALMIVGDWREHLLAADLDELTAFFADQRSSLDLTASEAEELAREFVDLSPAARLRRLDEVMHALPTTFYEHLLQRLADGAVEPHQLLPDDASVLARYCAADQDSPEARAKFMLQRAPWETVFDRLSGLPVRMPEAVVERFDGFSHVKQRALLRQLFNRSRTPIAAMHVLRLVARHVARPVLRRFIARVVFRALKSRAAIKDYLRCVRWFANELFRREECRGWSAATLLLATWTHAHQVLSRMSLLGYDFGEISSVMPLHVAHEAEFFADHTTIETPAHPNRVRPEQLLVCSLADALREHPNTLDDLTEDVLELALRKSDAQLAWHPNLYFGADVRNDPVMSYFNGRRIDQLRTLLGERFTDVDAETFGREFLNEVLREKLLVDEAWWPFVAARIQGDSEPEELACQSILETVELDGAAAALRTRSRAAWGMRLNTYSHAATTLGGDARARSIVLWGDCLRLVREQGGADRLDAAALLQSAADHARSEPDQDARIQQLAGDLERFVDGPAVLVECAWRIANGLRDRLPAADVDARLARIILVARASV